MRIVRVETCAAPAVWWQRWLIVRVETDEGLVGLGEGSIVGPYRAVDAAIHELAPVLIGRDPTNVEGLWHDVYHAWRARGGMVHQTAVSALDQALWDIAGKAAGLSVGRLLGGRVRDRVPVYASHSFEFVTDPAAVRDEAQALRERGFRALKWSPFQTFPLRGDERGQLRRIERHMTAIRDGFGDDTEVYVECAESLTRRLMSDVVAALAPFRPGWLEEPLPFEDPAALADVRASCPIPVATGERLLTKWEFRTVLAADAVDIVQPEVMHCGGPTEMRKIAALADAFSVPVAPHSSGGPVGVAASLQVAAHIPNLLVVEHMPADDAERERCSSLRLSLVDGCIEVPDLPGLGVGLAGEEWGDPGALEGIQRGSYASAILR